MGRAARDKGLLIVNNFVMYTAIMLRSPGPLIAAPSLPPSVRHSVDRAPKLGAGLAPPFLVETAEDATFLPLTDIRSLMDVSSASL